MRTLVMLVTTILIMGLGYCGEVKAGALRKETDRQVVSAVGEMQADVARTYAVDPPTICRLQQGASHE